MLDSFFAAYQKAGGEVDYIVCDNETGISNWEMNNAAKLYYENNTVLYYNAINRDPRFAAMGNLLLYPM